MTITSLYAVFSLPHISQVYMVFRGAFKALLMAPGAKAWKRG